MPSRTVVALLCLSLAPRAWAHANGISGYSGLSSGKTCASCHYGGATPTLSLTGPSTLAAGSSAIYTFTITGGPTVDGGLDVAVNGGATLQATGAGTQLLNGEITQSSAKTFSGGSLAFTFTVVAPASAGTFTIYAAGNSCNRDGTIKGDGPDNKTMAVTVSGSSCPADCTACSGTTCTACAADYFLSGGSCAACDAGCTSCTGPGACTGCASGSYLYQGACVTTCPAATYASGGACVACDSGCTSCTGPAACTACAAGYTLASGVCNATCPSGTYSSGGGCVACDPSCATCSTSATSCTSCPNRTYLFSGACISTCPTGYAPSGGACVDLDECLGQGSGNNCDPHATCTNTPGSFTCTCNSGYTGNGTTCTAAASSSGGGGCSGSGGDGGPLLAAALLLLAGSVRRARDILRHARDERNARSRRL